MRPERRSGPPLLFFAPPPPRRHGFGRKTGVAVQIAIPAALAETTPVRADTGFHPEEADHAPRFPAPSKVLGRALGDRSTGHQAMEREPPARVPGAILRALFEPTRHLAFAYPLEGAVRLNSDLAFESRPRGVRVVTLASKERLRIAGSIWDDPVELLAGSSHLIEEPRVRGPVIQFIDDPDFRGYWESLHRLFLNSVITAPSFGDTRTH